MLQCYILEFHVKLKGDIKTPCEIWFLDHDGNLSQISLTATVQRSRS